MNLIAFRSHLSVVGLTVLRWLSVFVFAIFACSSAFSNPTPCDTVQKNTEVKWRYLHQLKSFTQDLAIFDIESIKGFQHYEFSRDVNFFMASKGNIAHSARPLEFMPIISNGFQLYANEPFFGNSFNMETLRYYEPEHVFTDLFFVSGPRREQTFNVLHNQRFSDVFVLGLNYRVLNSPGRYTRTASANTNWYVNFHYNNPLKRYGAFGGFIINRVQNQESGGLKNRLEFEANRWSDAGILSEADLRDRETTLFVHQFIKARSPSFALQEDSLIQTNEDISGRLFHDFSFSKRAINFTDQSNPEPSFFGLQPANNTETRDSTIVFIVENSLGIMGEVPLGNETKLDYKAFVKHRFARIKQQVFVYDTSGSDETEPVFDYFNNSFGQIITGGEFALGFSKSMSLMTEGSLVALGKGQGDMGLRSTLSLLLPTTASLLQLNASLQLQEAPYFLSNFLGNYVSWQNSFKKQRIANAGVGFKNDLLDVKLNAYLLRDMVFVGPEAIPIQNPNSFGLISLRGGMKKTFGAFNTGHEILFQYAGTDNFERFPLLTSYHTFFFEFSLFKQAMFLNVGVDIYYNTPYMPMGFMPVVRQFYSQNTYKSGHVYTADFFGTFRIGRARLFLKAQNVGSEISSIPVVYQVPFYPIQDFAVKFGISWLFFD